MIPKKPTTTNAKATTKTITKTTTTKSSKPAIRVYSSGKLDFKLLYLENSFKKL